MSCSITCLCLGTGSSANKNSLFLQLHQRTVCRRYVLALPGKQEDRDSGWADRDSSGVTNHQTLLHQV